jgi:hypothetical protein
MSYDKQSHSTLLGNAHIDVVNIRGTFVVRYLPEGITSTYREVLGEHTSFNTAMLHARVNASALNVPIDMVECKKTENGYVWGHKISKSTRKIYGY